MIAHFSWIVDALASNSSLLQPIDEKSYYDWTKVHDFVCELGFILEPSARMYYYINKFAQFWVKLGDAFGYFTHLQRHRARNICVNPRCTGHSVRGIQQLICRDCLSGLYCSRWCQRV